ncbi:uncharacterized protein LOC142817663 isoform X2 [Rhipicephalus microplus]|uniref:uncharacterized protein LOC142817663 isoform X2 n=1 Tax=Rhipicephalus microplus TaxID=6941 RepID=UPI003F6D934D
MSKSPLWSPTAIILPVLARYLKWRGVTMACFIHRRLAEGSRARPMCIPVSWLYTYQGEKSPFSKTSVTLKLRVGPSSQVAPNAPPGGQALSAVLLRAANVTGKMLPVNIST